MDALHQVNQNDIAIYVELYKFRNTFVSYVCNQIVSYMRHICALKLSHMCNQINPTLIPGSPRISSPPGPISLELCFL